MTDLHGGEVVLTNTQGSLTNSARHLASITSQASTTTPWAGDGQDVGNGKTTSYAYL